MALNIPGRQIYAGRYHHGNIKTPDLFQEAEKTVPSKTRYLKDEVLKDTVTFSDEGLARSKKLAGVSQRRSGYGSFFSLSESERRTE